MRISLKSSWIRVALNPVRVSLKETEEERHRRRGEKAEGGLGGKCPQPGTLRPEQDQHGGEASKTHAPQSLRRPCPPTASPALRPPACGPLLWPPQDTLCRWAERTRVGSRRRQTRGGLPLAAAPNAVQTPPSQSLLGLSPRGAALHAPAQLPCPGSRVPGHRRS